MARSFSNAKLVSALVSYTIARSVDWNHFDEEMNRRRRESRKKKRDQLEGNWEFTDFLGEIQKSGTETLKLYNYRELGYAAGSPGLAAVRGEAASLFRSVNLGKKSEDRNPFNQVMSVSTSSSFVEKQVIGPEDGVEQFPVLPAVEDKYGGVVVELKGDQPWDSEVYTSSLRFSMSQWKQKGKKGVWIKLPKQLSNLVDVTVKEGFRYHHAEPDYLMLVHWIPETADSLPPNASHRVGIGAFVVNGKREVLVVQEANGSFRGTGVWKLPTGVVHEGEDIFAAAVREVKEETGIETEFVEMLAFRHSHKAFYRKSDLFFICMLKPHSFDIQKQDSEIAAAQWMPIEDYAAQPFVKENKLFADMAQICLAKLDNDYAGFTSRPTTTSTRKTSYLYFNNGKPTNFW